MALYQPQEALRQLSVALVSNINDNGRGAGCRY